MTMTGDLGKGIVPVLLARSLGVDPRGLALVGLAAVIGHCFPVFLRFRGGKGVSVTVAVLLVLDPTIFLVFALLWLVILLALGQVSSASLGAAAGTTMLVRFIGLTYPGILLFTWSAAVIIFLRHHENVDRLMAGTEKELFSPTNPFAAPGK